MIEKINNQALRQEIAEWESANFSNPKLIETAFFRVFVRFERFLHEAFENYALGKSSIRDFVPERKLPFENEQHLRGILKEKSKDYLDLNVDRIKNLSEHIFLNTQNNPFFNTYEDAHFKKNYNEMKIIRDYLAHLSQESKNKYQEKVLKDGYSYNI